MKKVFVKKTVCILLSVLMCFSVVGSMAFSAGAINYNLRALDDRLIAEAGENSITLTLQAPAKTVYGDGKNEKATLDGLEAFNAALNTSISESDIAYFINYNNQDPVALAAAPTDAGNYLATLSGSWDGENYTISTAYTIDKATIPEGSYTAPTAVEPLVYNGEFQDLLHAGSATVGTMEYGYVDDITGFTYIQSVPKGLNVGIYTILYRVYGGNNYYSTPEQEIIVKIVANKTALKAAIADAQTFVDNEANQNLASIGALNTALGAATTVDETELALQTEVDAATTALNTALQASTDEAAAAAVAAKIAAIGEVAYSESSKALIDAAQEAYDALSEEQKALVTNVQDLESAKSYYEQKKSAALEEAKERLSRAIDTAKAFYNVIQYVPFLGSIADALDTKIQQAQAVLDDVDATIEDYRAYTEMMLLALESAEEQKEDVESDPPAQSDDKLFNIFVAVVELVRFVMLKAIPAFIRMAK